MVGSSEYKVLGPTRTEDMAPQYTGCHAHSTETFCMAPDGEEVQILIEESPEEETEEPHHDDDDHGPTPQDCHFHAGVEHCVGGEEESTCQRSDRDYNVPLRIGLLFVILITSAIGVFAPIFVTSFTRLTERSTIFVTLKQFGTGVVISTAFIHLFTHAQLMFANECLGELDYEGTTAAVFMAGLMLSFLVDYLGARFILWRQGRKHVPGADQEHIGQNGESKMASETPNGSETVTHSDDRGSHVHVHGKADEQVSVAVLEAGIIFHSLLIGLTLVVAGDSFFLTLFAVILFHQMFEGIALGTCIAGLPSTVPLLREMIMALVFALITPLGMAIGIGVLDQFNGNDKSTLIAIGTLDALSAGILAWVGIVEMLARDWMHGSLLNAPLAKTLIAGAALVAGLILMSALGKWA
ncbi:Zip-domain-containing protein [Zopfia rhizophila CBS 207.26]|uniref:Zip-domain-containing protein n=1 Tax=Zopfia rhizophila CBS 207.26 TaxID=1314779 RepID=A0A6A6DUW8_9PEZI|nr:Zip-domain-containing protein [Zopfia rhizophila CBS 207.26]